LAAIEVKPKGNSDSDNSHKNLTIKQSDLGAKSPSGQSDNTIILEKKGVADSQGSPSPRQLTGDTNSQSSVPVQKLDKAINSQEKSPVTSESPANKVTPAVPASQGQSRPDVATDKLLRPVIPGHGQGQPLPAIPQQIARPPQHQLPIHPRGRDFTLNFDDSDIYEVIHTVFGEILRVNYTVDPKIKGRITFRSVAPVEKDKVLPLMEVIFRLHDIAIVEEGGLTRIVPSSSLARGAKVYVHHIQNGLAKDIAEQLQRIFLGARHIVRTSGQAARAGSAARPGSPPAPPYPIPHVEMERGRDAVLSEEAKIVADESANTVIIYATPEEYQAIKEAIVKIDVTPRQVLIEATILDVVLSDSLSLGVNALYSSGGVNYVGMRGIKDEKSALIPDALNTMGKGLSIFKTPRDDEPISVYHRPGRENKAESAFGPPHRSFRRERGGNKRRGLCPDQKSGCEQPKYNEPD
jgi:hypothetical protein